MENNMDLNEMKLYLIGSILYRLAKKIDKAETDGKKEEKRKAIFLSGVCTAFDAVRPILQAGSIEDIADELSIDPLWLTGFFDVDQNKMLN